MQHTKNMKYTYPAFIASLFIHTTLVAAGIYLAKTEVEKPLPQETMISMKLSNYIATKSEPTPAVQAPTPPPKKEIVQKPKKEIIKKEIVKKVPLKELKPQEIPQKQEKIVETVVPLEAFTPQVTNEVADAQLNEKPLYSPKKQDFVQHDTPPSKQVVQEGVDDATLSLIRSMIQNSLVYPALAKRLKLEGVVVISFTLTRDGRVESAKIVKKSKSTSLDTKALQTVTSLSGKYPQLEKQIQLQIPVAFSLKRS
ncbi:MAG: TonB family protein [Sulfurimonadaceae bacterium]|nr:TonB family protein [Sulfurimonadaceae bacterium]